MSRSKPSRKRSSQKSKTPKPYLLGKPHGQLHARVQCVGPEHFGVVCVDGGKHGSKFMFANFYGQPLILPTKVKHTHGELQAACDRTGEYHRPMQRACRERHWDTRLTHPFGWRRSNCRCRYSAGQLGSIRLKPWDSAGKDPRWIRVKIVKCFSRLAFAMLMSRQIFRHPCCQQRHYILGKLLEFHTEHKTPTDLFRADMEAACDQLPKNRLGDETKSLEEHLATLAHKRGPQPLADLISIILARANLRRLQSRIAGEEDPNAHA